MIAVLVSQPLGMDLQRYFTTDGVPGTLEIISITRSDRPALGRTYRHSSGGDALLTMSKPVKTFYILHGDDDFTIEREAEVFRAKMNETPNGDLNTSEFDGEGANIHEILNAARSYPFLAKQRLVLVKDLLAWVTPQRGG